MKILKAEGSNVNYLRYLKQLSVEEELELVCARFKTAKARISDRKFRGGMWWHDRGKNSLRNEASRIDFLTQNTRNVCRQEQAGDCVSILKVRMST